jgi:PIN domain nuclease of toxin-antitoxin system
MAFLLDTNVLIWLCQEVGAIPKPTLEVLENTSETLWLSSISVWEICQKHGRGKLLLPDSPQDLITYARDNFRIETLPFKESDSYRFFTLPELHRDPFDRMLICQAIQNNLTLVTSDRAIRQYPIATIW